MNKYIVILVMLLCVSSVMAGYAEYLLIDPPNPMTSWMLISDGQGSIDSLVLDSLRVHGNSNISIKSGWLGNLGVGDTSTVNIYRTGVSHAAAVDFGTIIFHAPAFRFDGNYVFRVFDNVIFRTELHQGNFVFQTIPEPTTIILLGLGIIFAFRKRRKYNEDNIFRC